MLKFILIALFLISPQTVHAASDASCQALNAALKKIGYKRIVKEAEKRGYTEADVKYYINYCSKGKQ